MKDSLFKIAILACVFTFAGIQIGEAKIEGRPVKYSSQGVAMKGYLVYDDSIKEKRPGVLVVHEWWGLNEYIRKRARKLAELGYVALGLDMYGEGKQIGRAHV